MWIIRHCVPQSLITYLVTNQLPRPTSRETYLYFFLYLRILKCIISAGKVNSVSNKGSTNVNEKLRQDRPTTTYDMIECTIKPNQCSLPRHISHRAQCVHRTLSAWPTDTLLMSRDWLMTTEQQLAGFCSCVRCVLWGQCRVWHCHWPAAVFTNPH